MHKSIAILWSFLLILSENFEVTSFEKTKYVCNILRNILYSRYFDTFWESATSSTRICMFTKLLILFSIKNLKEIRKANKNFMYQMSERVNWSFKSFSWLTIPYIQAAQKTYFQLQYVTLYLKTSINSRSTKGFET